MEHLWSKNWHGDFLRFSSRPPFFHLCFWWTKGNKQDKLSIFLRNEVQRVPSLPATIKVKCMYSTSPLRNGNKTWWMQTNQSGWLFFSPEVLLLLHSQSSQTLLLCSVLFVSVPWSNLWSRHPTGPKQLWTKVLGWLWLFLGVCESRSDAAGFERYS